MTDGLKFLILTLEYPDFIVPNSFFDKFEKPVPQTALPDSEIYLTLIPPEIFDQLTEFEKLKLQTIASKDKNLICVEAVFTIETFPEHLKELQTILNEKGEIIFTLPSEKIVGEKEIGFEIFVSTDEGKEVFENAVKDFKADVNLLTAPAGFSNDLSGILSKIVSQGKIWANNLGKKAEFKILV